jgi:uncharacterized OB-fold protein
MTLSRNSSMDALEAVRAIAEEAMSARQTYADRLDGHVTAVRCSACGRAVQPRTQDAGFARVLQVVPIDRRGRCPLCAWDEAT